ncbi:hypothetical protein CN469_04285, partial [Bacillus cereus]
TGPTGAILLSSGYFWSTTTGNVNSGAIVPLASGQNIIGSTITFTAPGTINIATPGIYLVSYGVTADPLNLYVAIELQLNGISIPGSSIFESDTLAGGTSDLRVTNTMFIQVLTNNSTLTIINSSSQVFFKSPAPNATTTTANLNIIQLA